MLSLPDPVPVSLPVCMRVSACVQSSKLQSLYSQTEAAFKESDAKVKQLSSELATAQMEAKGLKNELRNVQVSRLIDWLGGRSVSQSVCWEAQGLVVVVWWRGPMCSRQKHTPVWFTTA